MATGGQPSSDGIQSWQPKQLNQSAGSKERVFSPSHTFFRSPIMGAYIGDRSGESAQVIWMSLPARYRQCAVIYTDRLSSYPVALPSKRHRPVGKDSGYTSYIERVNNTMRQRVSRLVRKTLPPQVTLRSQKMPLFCNGADYLLNSFVEVMGQFSLL